MTGQDLKNSILQLAIQGKLVPQDANDEPASVLLERIKSEKQKLINEKKIKKEKPLPEITDEEKPFEIPETWEWCRLANIVSILGDGIHGTPQYDENGDFYFVNGNNLFQGRILIKPDTKRCNKAEYEKHKKNLNENTMFVSINGTIGNYAFYENEPIFLGKSACYFNLMQSDLKWYMQYFVQSKFFLEYALGNATGSTIKNVSLGTMNNLPIPLPPLSELHRIVAKIEELMPLVEEYDKAQKELDALNAKLPEALKKSILQEAIQGKLVPQDPNDEPASVLLQRIRKEKEQLVKDGKLKKKDLVTTPISDEEKPFEIPESWEWCRLEEILQFINGDRGKNYPSKDKLQLNGEIPFISAINIESGTISRNNLLFLNREQYDALGSGKLLKNDIVVCIRGSLGKACIYPYEIGAIASSLVITRRYITLSNKYILNYIKSPLFFEEVDKYNNGTAQPNLGARDVMKFLIPLPPLAEQHRIVSKIEDLFAQIEPLAKALSTPM